jgi:hypothetical protein
MISEMGFTCFAKKKNGLGWEVKLESEAPPPRRLPLRLRRPPFLRSLSRRPPFLPRPLLSGRGTPALDPALSGADRALAAPDLPPVGLVPWRVDPPRDTPGWMK